MTYKGLKSAVRNKNEELDKLNYCSDPFQSNWEDSSHFKKSIEWFQQKRVPDKVKKQEDHQNQSMQERKDDALLWQIT